VQPSAGRASAIQAAVDRFLAVAREPAVIEPGEDPIRIGRHNFALEARGPGLMVSCWDEQRNLVRKASGIKLERRGHLELETERFGGKKGLLIFLDLAHPANAPVTRRGGRMKYREQFRLSLRRQFPDWRLVELSTDADLEHSLSPAYPRALLKKGSAAIAAVGAAEDSMDPDGALSFGLIWLDYLRRRETRVAVGGLAVFLPVGSEVNTCHRVRCLDPDAVQFMVFVYGAGGAEEAVDPAGYANFETRLEPFLEPRSSAWMERLSEMDGVEQRRRPDGSVSFCVHGMEFARSSGSRLLLGIDRKHAVDEAAFSEVAALARGLARMRQAEAEDRVNPLYTRHPEAWLESQVRSNLRTLDATLLAAPMYGQAPEFAAGNRNILDLLTIDYQGRLAVIEVKAAQDIHLPLQALDYWMRVKWHLERGEFAGRGYFPGVPLRNEPPRLLLVAPAFEFHPTNPAILRFFSKDVQVERIGVGLEWRRELQVMFRTLERGRGR
jgi:hypothetical protein